MGGASSKESIFQCKRSKRHRFSLQVGKTPWRRAWQPTQVFFPGESHGRRSLVGYSPRGTESDMTEWLMTLLALPYTTSPDSGHLWNSFHFLKLMSIWGDAFGCFKPPTHVRVKSLQSRPTLCSPMDCSPPGFSVHGILQARTLEWVAVPSSRGSSWFRDQTQVSCIYYICRQVLYHLGSHFKPPSSV